MARVPGLFRLLLLAILPCISTACGGDSGGPKGPQHVVLEGDPADFLVCRDTVGNMGTNPISDSGLVGNLEYGDSLIFLAGECRTVLLFNSSALSAIADPTTIDSVRLEVFILGSEPGTVPSGDMVVESIEWSGNMLDAFDAIDMSVGPVTFSPSTGGYLLDASDIPAIVGTDGLIAYRLRMQAPDPLDGATHGWDVGMGDGPAASVAKLTFYWTP